MSYKEWRLIKWNEQDGICPLCSEGIEKAEPAKSDLHFRTGKPKKAFDPLWRTWLMRIVPKSQGGPKQLDNLVLVHPNCGQSFQNWLYAKPGREFLKSHKTVMSLFKADLGITKGGFLVHLNDLRGIRK